MDLVNLTVSNYRSIECTSLRNVGAFNVLIGRNNAGKSALLSAVKLYFDCISKGAVNTEPPVRDKLDFHNGDQSSPIKLVGELALALPDRDHLIREIVQEYPQMQNALDGISTDLSVCIDLIIEVTGQDEYLSYVTSMVLKPAGHGATEHFEYNLLGLSPSAAGELARIERGVRLVRRRRDICSTATSVVRNRGFAGATGSDLTYFADSVSLRMERKVTSGEIRRVLEPLVQGSTSSDQVMERLTESVANCDLEIERLRSSEISTSIGTFAGESRSIPSCVTSLLLRIGEMNIQYLTERRTPIGPTEAQRLLDLKVKRGGTEVLARIQRTVAGLLGVNIDAFRAESRANRRFSEAELDVDDFLVQANGAGIREALRIVLDVEFNSTSILLIEEPEIHLHPALEIALMRYLLEISSDTQVFIATHSTNFLDTASMSSVYMVRKGSATEADGLSLEDIKIEIPKELGIRLSSLFMYDRLVFVEGSSDELVLRELAAKLGYNLAEKNLGFIVMGGVGNFAHYAARATLEFLSRRQVRSYFILDKDERIDSDIANLRNMLKGDSKLLVLGRRELENYLLDPNAVAALIRERVPSATVDAEEIASHIEQECASLQSLAVELRVGRILGRPLHIMSRKSDGHELDRKGLAARLSQAISELDGRIRALDSTFAEQEGLVEVDWERRRKEMVPGTLLLEKVFLKYGMRYQKDRDGVALAGHLNTRTIPSDMARILAVLVED